MNILVIGSGGREHALVHTFHRQGHQVYCLPGNAGTDQFSETISEPCSTDDHPKLAELVKKYGIDFTVVGPETPLAAGIADHFATENLPLFGPFKKAAILESSKVWAKEFMSKYRIPTARYVICRNQDEARHAVHRYFPEWRGVVIKPNGLTAGKGVMCCEELHEAEQAIDAVMGQQEFGHAGQEVVIEEMLSGPEVSILAFCDGRTMVPMIPSQDHKRLEEGDRGPNTGGMGAYAPVSIIDENLFDGIRESIIEKTNFGLKQEGIDYRGVLYFGLMVTDSGPKVLEYNCRFGDPEAQVVLPLLKSNLAEVMLSCCHGNLNNLDLAWIPQAACCVVMASGGYPKEYKKGCVIQGLDNHMNQQDIICFHAGTKKNENGDVVTSGGRVLGITGLGNNLEQAIQAAYRGAGQIQYEKAYYRKDIAHKALLPT